MTEERSSPSRRNSQSAESVAVPRWFLETFIGAVDFHDGHGTPSLQRAEADVLYSEARRLVNATPMPVEGFYEKLWKDFVSIQRGDAAGILAKVERYYREQAERSEKPRSLKDATLAELEQANEGYPGIAHDLETFRTALQKIADDWPRQTNEGAQKWAREALKNAAPREITAEASSPVLGEDGKVPQSEGTHTHPVPTREDEAARGAAPQRQGGDKPNAVEEAKRRLRRAIKLFHNAEEHWSTEMIAEFEDGAPKDMTLLEWIDAGIEAIPSANAQPNVYKEAWEQWRSLQTGDAMKMMDDALRYRWLRHDSKSLDLEQRKATIVEVYQGAAMDEQIDKAMGANPSSATEGTAKT